MKMVDLFILNFADVNDDLYEMALRVADEALCYYLSSHISDMHEIHCFVDFVEYCDLAQICELKNMDEFKLKLKMILNILLKKMLTNGLPLTAVCLHILLNLKKVSIT